MKFKIRCGNIKEYDPKRQGYVSCNCMVEVGSDQIGTVATCPDCGNDIEVVSEAIESSPSSGLSSGDPASSLPAETAVEPGSTGAASPEDLRSWDAAPGNSAADKANEDLENSETDSPESTTTPPPDSSLELEDYEPVAEEFMATDDRRWSAKSSTPRSAPESMPPRDSGPQQSSLPPTNFPPAGVQESSAAGCELSPLRKESFKKITSPQLRSADFDRSLTCHKCGTLLKEKIPVCPNCKTPRRAAYVDKKDRKAFSSRGPFGFQLWLDSITSRTEGNKHTFFAVNVLLLILLAATGLSALIIADVLGKLVGVLLLAIAFFFFVAMQTAGKLRKDPRTPLPPMIRLAWSWVYHLIRATRFKKYKSEVILDAKEKNVGDRQIREMTDLNRFKVIDLEGSDVSDDALLFMHHLRGIHFLNLRQTQVSEEAVQDLQETIPKTWIWY